MKLVTAIPVLVKAKKDLNLNLHQHSNARCGCKDDRLHPCVYKWLFCPSIVCHLEPGMYLIMVARGGAVGQATALQAGRSRVRFPVVVLAFFIDVMVPAA